MAGIGALIAVLVVLGFLWVQMLAQGSILVWWGWHVQGVYGYFVLILAQILFAFGVDALLQWSRRGTWRMTFGPIPVMFSMNLFLWFKPDWFHWQFAMVALGFLAKEFLKWTRDGRSTHIFNPSSFSPSGRRAAKQGTSGPAPIGST